jgi:hypothetical protein
MGILAAVIAFAVALPILLAPLLLLGIRRLRLPQPQTKWPVLELVWANWFGHWMWKRNWGGLTTWLPFCNVISYWAEDPEPEVRVHEFDHVAERDRVFWGDPLALVSWVHYTWDAIRYGYAKNPMETEAYAVEAEAVKHGLPDWARPPSDPAP